MSARVEQESEVGLDGPLGLRFSVRGQNLVAVFLGIVFVGGILGFLWWHNSNMELENTRLVQKMDEVVYVISLPQEKRDALNLTMPDTLRQKRRWRHDDGTP